jgi:flavin reductase (DIM6/NTAB) family NADH-FMN oxidoreductase RutF
MQHPITEVQKLTSPNQFCLITSYCGKEKTNIMALSWWTYVSNKPATIAICLSQNSFSSSLINKEREFGLCVVDETLKEAAFDCGTCSGRDVDKAETFGVELMNASEIKPRLVKAHKIALECKVIDSLNVQDHIMFIAEVKSIHLNPDKSQLFSFEGYRRLDVLENFAK